MRIAELRPHPLNEEIYGDRADADLVASIAERGVLNPILISPSRLIISGHRRWGAAAAAGHDSVPVVYFGSDDPLDIAEALIESNRQRQKTNEQIGREYKQLKTIIHEREARRGNQYTESASASQEAEAKPTKKAAASLGVSQPTAVRAEAVVDAIDALRSVGKAEEAKELSSELERSVKGAYEKVRSATTYWTPEPAEAEPETETEPEATPPPPARPHVVNNSGNNEWYTPSIYIEAARQVLGTIELDPASSATANDVVQAEEYYDIEDDGLTLPWEGNVWLNPPYGRDLIAPFIEKICLHARSGEITAAIVLVNNATETDWFQTLAAHADALCFPRSRIRYWNASGTHDSPLQGQAFAYIGPDKYLFGSVFSQFGIVLSEEP